MVNVTKIKNELKGTVSKLTPKQKAELYYLDRKRYIKLGIQGKISKARELLKRNDQLFRENSTEYPITFLNAHIKFLNWLLDFNHFKMERSHIYELEREINIYGAELEYWELIEELLSYRDTSDDYYLKQVLNLIKNRKTWLNKNINELHHLIEQSEALIKKDEVYRKQDYFRDVFTKI